MRGRLVERARYPGRAIDSADDRSARALKRGADTDLAARAARAVDGEHRKRQYELGIQHAADALTAEPFDEQACQALMRAHAAAGKRAEALRVYAACRKLFREELGAEPSKKTAAVFLDVLRSTA